jgi:hypothetical protein
MNKIILNRPIFFNNRYFVYLDTNNKFSFRNKRETQDFIVQVGREMDEAILFITEKFNLLEELYRLYYLADKDYKFKFQISNSIDFLNNRLAWMQSHEGSPNHDAILFQAEVTCIEELKTSFACMRDKAATRKDTITKRRCALKLHLLEIYHKEFLSLGIKPKETQLRLTKQGKA